MHQRTRTLRLTAAAAIAAVGIGAPAFAAPRAHNAATSGGCALSGSVVSATGLPTDQVINFMISDASGTDGWVLGTSGDGTWNVSVPAPDGATTYAFTSRTWGSNGSKYTVFASCSA
jgi:hypothetical protein